MCILLFVPRPPQPKLSGLKFVIDHVLPPSKDSYIPCVVPLCEFFTFIKILWELKGETAMVFTPDAIKKSVEFVQVSPPLVVFQKPPLLDPKKILSSSIGST